MRKTATHHIVITIHNSGYNNIYGNFYQETTHKIEGRGSRQPKCGDSCRNNTLSHKVRLNNERIPFVSGE